MHSMDPILIVKHIQAILCLPLRNLHILSSLVVIMLEEVVQGEGRDKRADSFEHERALPRLQVVLGPHHHLLYFRPINHTADLEGLGEDELKDDILDSTPTVPEVLCGTYVEPRRLLLAI
jgi:hypothetical protein